MSGEPKTLTLEKRRESAAATILRHLQAGPATVAELMDRIHADTTRPEVGTPGWRIVTTHLVADTLSAVEALGDLLGQKLLSRDERGAIALTLPPGVPVVARDETAELRAAAIEWARADRAASEAHKAWLSEAAKGGASYTGAKAISRNRKRWSESLPSFHAWVKASAERHTAKERLEALARRLAGGENER